jgi:hypothetical protein
MPNDNHLMSEEQVPGNWTAIEKPATIPGQVPPGAPAPPLPQAMPQFFSGSLAPQLQLGTRFVATESASPLVPKTALMPFGLQASAITNAAAQSTVIKTAPVVLQQAAVTVGLNVPSIFTPVSQSVNLPGVLSIGLAKENARTVFAGPAGSAASPYLDGATSTSATAHSITLAATAQYTDLVFSITSGSFAHGTAMTTPTGFTLINNPGGQSPLSMAIVAPGALSVSSSYTSSNTTNDSISGLLALFSFNGGTLPTVTQIASVGGAWGTSTQNITGTVPANVALIAVFTAGGLNASPSGTGGTTGLSDTAGNSWAHVAESVHGDIIGGTDGSAVSLYFCANPAAGSTTFSMGFSMTVGGSAFSDANFIVYTVSAGIILNAAIPTFRLLTLSDMPPGITSPSYQNIESHSVLVTPQRPNLNFLAPLQAADNAGNSSTDVSAAVFVASGTNHATGIVPDPGAVAGTTHFLREDATWAVPASGGGGGFGTLNNAGLTNYFNWNSSTGILTIGFGQDTVSAQSGNASWTALEPPTSTRSASSSVRVTTTDTACGFRGSGFSGNPVTTFDFSNLQYACMMYMGRTTDVRFYNGLVGYSSLTNTLGATSIVAGVKGAYFRFDTTLSDANIMCVTSDGTTINAQSSGVSADTNTHRYAIVIVPATSVKFYIDYNLVATSVANLPTGTSGWIMTGSWHTATVNPLLGFSMLMVSQ